MPEPSLHPTHIRHSSFVIRHLPLLLLAFGILWRIVRYALAMPIWGDEAMIGLNILNRSYADLLKPLDHFQVAPILFLWSERFIFEHLGMSELAMRLLPLLAGIAALLLFHQWVRLIADPLPAAFATAIVAVSYYIVRHGTELKPYSYDLLAALLLLYPATYFLLRRRSPLILLGLLLLLPIVLAMSYPAVFVAGAIALALLVTIRKQPPLSRILTILYLLAVPAIFYVLLKKVTQGQYDRTSADMTAYWKDAFPPINPFAFLWWFIKIHIGNLFAYPVGGKNGASILSVALAVVGLIVFWRKLSTPIKLLLFTPFLLTFIAAAMHRYPYGESARVSQHLAPAICLLIGMGVAALIDRFAATPLRRQQAIAGVFIVYLVIGLCGLAGNLIWPYKTKPDLDARTAIRSLIAQSNDDPMLVILPAQKPPFNFLWYLHERRTRPTYFTVAASFNIIDIPLTTSSPIWIVNCDETQAKTISQTLEAIFQGPITQKRLDRYQIGPRQDPPALLQVLYRPPASPTSAP